MKWKKRKAEIEYLRMKHGGDRRLVRSFPNLKVEQRTAPCSNRFGPPPLLPKDKMEAILGPDFVVSHLHKGAYQVLLRSELLWAGKKP